MIAYVENVMQNLEAALYLEELKRKGEDAFPPEHLKMMMCTANKKFAKLRKEDISRFSKRVQLEIYLRSNQNTRPLVEALDAAEEVEDS